MVDKTICRDVKNYVKEANKIGTKIKISFSKNNVKPFIWLHDLLLNNCALCKHNVIFANGFSVVLTISSLLIYIELNLHYHIAPKACFTRLTQSFIS